MKVSATGSPSPNALALKIPASRVSLTANQVTPEQAEKILTEIAVSGPMIDPNSVELEMPPPAQPVLNLDSSGNNDSDSSLPKGTRNLKLRWVEEGYFDAGYERLLGTFSTQILRYGVRYGADDLHVYVKNETLNTIGTGLPYPQAITGLSAGVEARHWFPGDQMYAVISLGEGISGYDAHMADFRYGLVGYTSWSHDRWFSDFYGEFFYIALAADTFLDARLRSGRIWKKYKDGSYLWGYAVGQFWVSGQVESPTENRMEAGLGIGYVYKQSISLNFELRGGYAYRSPVDDGGDMVYFNPTIILSGGFYK